MPKKKSTKTLKINNIQNRPIEINYIGNGTKHTARYADTTVYDLYLFQDRISQDQHHNAEWLHSLALRSNIKLTVQSFLSNPVRLGNGATAGMSERSAQSRLTLIEVLDYVSKNCGRDYTSLLEGIVMHNQSLSDWSKSTGKSRSGKLQMLQHALDEVGKYREM